VQGSSKGSRSRLHGNVAGQQELLISVLSHPVATMPSDYLPQPLYQHELQSYSSSTSTPSTDHPLRREQPGHFEPTVRRRARVAASTPVRAMSLVGLKHIFFRQTITPSISKSDSRDQYSKLFPPLFYIPWDNSSSRGPSISFKYCLL
jgi:hypothetical protein